MTKARRSAAAAGPGPFDGARAMMRPADISSCYLGPQISPEQFIAEHIFLFLAQGTIDGYDGHRHYTLHPGECCLVRKNHFARYTKRKAGGAFTKVVVIFDEAFLRGYAERHAVKAVPFHSPDAFLGIRKSRLVPTFLRSLMPHYDGKGGIDQRVADRKREELLTLLLRIEPKLAAVLFDFGMPQKIDLEAFMQRNFRFNAGLERFAFLTGRSLSAFKRDFKRIFRQSPGRWLVQQRLREARFLIERQHQRASDIYLDLGFEDLSHFSYAFKKQFGVAPTQVGG